ncbi:MAG: hypothetical protein ABI321_00270 [Polyangia bacterium]
MKPSTVLLALTVSGIAWAQPKRVELPQLFPSKAEVTITESGLQALELPISVIEKCRAGLPDLRLWRGDSEVPYLVDSTAEVWTLAESAPLEVDNVVHDRKSPLCDRLAASPSWHCEVLEGTTTAKGAGWELVFDLPDSRFVEAVGLRLGGHEISGGSLFRLPGGPDERVRIPLPVLAEHVRLGVVLKGDGSALSPRLHLERGRSVRGSGLVESPLRITARWHDRAGSHLLLDRSPGLLPSALRFVTKTPTFDRAVAIYDYTGEDSRRLVGQGRLSRVSMTAGGEKVAIEQLDVPLGVPRAHKLEVVIDDGDSPSLDPEIRAVLARPTLVFYGDPQQPPTLLFGGGRAEAPRYDLQSLLPPNTGVAGIEGVRAEVAARLHAREGLHVATLSAPTSNPAFDPTPALRSVAHPGTEVALATYAHVRPLELSPSADGLSRYVLAPADLAAARPDLADVRIVDEKNRQWPYLVDPVTDAAIVELAQPTRTSKPGVSRYELALPAAPLVATELVLDVQEGFFERNARLVIKDQAGRERTLDGMRLHRALGTTSEGEAVLLHLDGAQVSSLAIEVTDGGDAPLTITSARLRVPTSALLLAAERGRYRLLVGDPDAEAPTYELRALTDLIAQLDATDAKASPLVDNPAFSRTARLGGSGARERLLVWLALGLAVLVLGALTLRLARTPEEPNA